MTEPKYMTERREAAAKPLDEREVLALEQHALNNLTMNGHTMTAVDVLRLIATLRAREVPRS
jgi:hypothetical protein